MDAGAFAAAAHQLRGHRAQERLLGLLTHRLASHRAGPGAAGTAARGSPRHRRVLGPSDESGPPPIPSDGFAAPGTPGTLHSACRTAVPSAPRASRPGMNEEARAVQPCRLEGACAR
ncbi:hypothetical protein NS331_24100 [Pseudacidovorax intermedius]|uniref:Uncharacterized protein n=1 Tax=Pseudacidovorax intermedius TaxID=433924 RepID=A0A147GLC5_9BURK|nr:hypothetical protein NS331_24100 [Pseudacidovorax intermedius]